MTQETHLPLDYPGLLADIKQRVRHAQTRAWLAVNAEMIRLYWEIGALIDSRQRREGWGAAVIPRLARDLQNELPEEKGFFERNIKRMLAFYREYPDAALAPQAVALPAIPSTCRGPEPTRAGFQPGAADAESSVPVRLCRPGGAVPRRGVGAVNQPHCPSEQ